MGSFGERLQREREMRGITLEEIAEATKIGTRSLRALEEEEFDKLPGGIFNKGFVRAYSRYLGIDEEQAVADYMTALGETLPSGKALKPELVASAAPDKNLGNIDDEEPRVPQMAWAALAALVILCAAGFAGARYVSRNGWPQLRRAQAASAPLPTTPAPAPATAPPPSTTAAAQPPATPAVEPVGTSTGPASETSAATAITDGFLLRVRAKKDTWVLLIVDGKQEMSGTLSADAERAVRAQNRVVFKTGNAAAVELFQDGKPLPLAGEEKQVRQVTITAQGIQEGKKSE